MWPAILLVPKVRSCRLWSLWGVSHTTNLANGNSQILTAWVGLCKFLKLRTISLIDFLLKRGNTCENSKIVSTLRNVVQNISPILPKFPKKYNQSLGQSRRLWAFCKDPVALLWLYIFVLWLKPHDINLVFISIYSRTLFTYTVHRTTIDVVTGSLADLGGSDPI